MDVQVGLLFEPPPGHGSKVFQILEVSSIQEIPFNVLKRSLNFSLGAVRQLHNVTNLRSNFFG